MTIKLQSKYYDANRGETTSRDLKEDEPCYDSGYYILVSIDGARIPLPIVLLNGPTHAAFNLCREYVRKAIEEGWDFWDRRSTSEKGWVWDNIKGKMVTHGF
jgi:hypothetical protein